MKSSIILQLLFISIFSFSQTKEADCWLNVLKKNITGKEFTFGKWTQEKGTETTLTYLGSVKTKKGKTYKLMNSVFTWGNSGRVTCRILVFNQNNKSLGNYYIGDECNLPSVLKNGYLIFKKYKKCDVGIETKN